MIGLTACQPQAPNPSGLPEQEVVFTSSRDGAAQIFRAAATGGKWTALTTAEDKANWPTWSPDGKHIAYHSSQDGNFDVWIMNADGSGKRRLTDHPAHDYLPSWAPDGEFITFVSRRTEAEEAEEQPHYYSMKVDGSEQRRQIAESPGGSAALHWHPKGSSVVYAKADPAGRANLIVADNDGKNPRTIVADGRTNGAPKFSPNGEWLAFYSDDGQQSRIEIVRSDGSDRRIIYDSETNWYPAWSADGKWIMFTLGSGGGQGDMDLYAVNVDDPTDAVLIAGSPGRELEGDWRPIQ